MRVDVDIKGTGSGGLGGSLVNWGSPGSVAAVPPFANLTVTNNKKTETKTVALFGHTHTASSLVGWDSFNTSIVPSGSVNLGDSSHYWIDAFIRSLHSGSIHYSNQFNIIDNGLGDTVVAISEEGVFFGPIQYDEETGETLTDNRLITEGESALRYHPRLGSFSLLLRASKLNFGLQPYSSRDTSADLQKLYQRETTFLYSNVGFVSAGHVVAGGLYEGSGSGGTSTVIWGDATLDNYRPLYVDDDAGTELAIRGHKHTVSDITDLIGFDVIVEQTLPTTDLQNYKGKLVLVPKPDSAASVNIYNEYVLVSENNTYRFELIGDTTIDISSLEDAVEELQLHFDTSGHLKFSSLPALYIGKTTVQNSASAQALSGITEITLDVASAQSLNPVYNTVLKWDSVNYAWRLSRKSGATASTSGNLIADGFIVAGGIYAGSSGGGGGSNVDWESLFSSGLKIADITVDESTSDVFVPFASSSQVGVIKPGTHFSVDSNGTLGINSSYILPSVSDWNNTIRKTGTVTDNNVAIFNNGDVADSGIHSSALALLSSDNQFTSKNTFTQSIWTHGVVLTEYSDAIYGRIGATNYAPIFRIYTNSADGKGDLNFGIDPGAGGTATHDVNFIGASIRFRNKYWSDTNATLLALTDLALYAYRNIEPGGDATLNLGASSLRWNNLYLKRWYPKQGDTSVYVEYDATTDSFYFHGNITASGSMSAGGNNNVITEGNWSNYIGNTEANKVFYADNALKLGGVLAANYARRDADNTFTANNTFQQSIDILNGGLKFAGSLALSTYNNGPILLGFGTCSSKNIHYYAYDTHYFSLYTPGDPNNWNPLLKLTNSELTAYRKIIPNNSSSSIGQSDGLDLGRTDRQWRRLYARGFYPNGENGPYIDYQTYYGGNYIVNHGNFISTGAVTAGALGADSSHGEVSNNIIPTSSTLTIGSENGNKFQYIYATNIGSSVAKVANIHAVNANITSAKVIDLTVTGTAALNDSLRIDSLYQYLNYSSQTITDSDVTDVLDETEIIDNLLSGVYKAISCQNGQVEMKMSVAEINVSSTETVIYFGRHRRLRKYSGTWTYYNYWD